MTPTHHTELTPFVLDLLDFMERKIRAGLDDEDARAKAVDEAAGVVPLLRERLSDNGTVQAQALFVVDKPIYDVEAAKWWTDLAGMDRPEFEIQATDLLRWLALLRQVVTADPEPS